MRACRSNSMHPPAIKLGHTLLGLTSLLLAACGSLSAAPARSAAAGDIGQVIPLDGWGFYKDIQSQELRAMLGTGDVFFVNVYVPYEGEIGSTDAFIPYLEIVNHQAKFPDSKDATIVVYCRSGSMSEIAARRLVEAGYSNVHNLEGGFRAWKAAGFELIQDQ